MSKMRWPPWGVSKKQLEGPRGLGTAEVGMIFLIIPLFLGTILAIGFGIESIGSKISVSTLSPVVRATVSSTECEPSTKTIANLKP